MEAIQHTLISIKVLKKLIRLSYSESIKYFDESRINDIYFNLSRCIDLQYIIEHPDKPWFWQLISLSDNITIKDVVSHPDLPWYWKSVSCNPNITMKDITNHPNLPWNYKWLSMNPTITEQDILDHPNIPWDYYILSQNKNISLKFILQHPNESWDYQYINLANKKTLFYQTELQKCQKDLLWLIRGKLQKTMWKPGNYYSQKMLEEIVKITN